MSFSTSDLKHIAQLARLTLTESELKQYRREISGIVSYVNKLAEVNVSQEIATTNLATTNNLLRADIVLECAKTDKELALQAVPRKKNNLVAVPRIFEL